MPRFDMLRAEDLGSFHVIIDTTCAFCGASATRCGRTAPRQSGGIGT